MGGYKFVDERRYKCMNLQGGGVYRIRRKIHVGGGGGYKCMSRKENESTLPLRPLRG